MRPALPPCLLLFQGVDQVDGGVEARPLTGLTTGAVPVTTMN